LIVCQIARGHYFVIWLPTVMFTSTWLLRRGRPQLAAWHAIVPATLVFVHYLFLSSAGNIGLLGLGTAAWYTSACIAVLRVKPIASVAAAPTCNECRARKAA
jgi:hypothetical protein